MSGLRYRVRYASHRSLDADHVAYLSHGGYVVPLTGDDAAPENEPLVLELVAPDGTRFELVARSGQSIPNHGFMLSFEADADDERRRLDGFVASADFAAAKANEPGETEPPSVERVLSGPTAAADDADNRPTADGLETLIDESLDLPDDLLDDDDDLLGDADDDDGLLTAEATPASGAADDETHIEAPAPGADYALYAAKFEHVATFDDPARRLDETRTIELTVEEPTFGPGQVARLRLTLPGHNVFEMWARIVDVTPSTVVLRVGSGDEQARKAVLYPSSRSARTRREREAGEEPAEVQVIRIEASVPDEDKERMPIRRRLQRMGMDEKINLALTGDRQARMALATDSNKAVHHYLLKNAKITLDEIASMARLPSLNPDVLEKIAENPQYTQNPSVAKALVYNPKTPVGTAVRMLDRLPRNEVVLLAKRTNLNPRLINAAKKKVGDAP